MAVAKYPGTNISVKTGVFTAFARQMKLTAPSVYKTMNKQLKQAGQTIADQAAENADWSYKIPRTLRWSSSNVRVTVRAGYPSVFIAWPYEFGRTQRSPVWRHPVFPHGPRKDWTWVAQRDPFRPYLAPALQEKKQEIVEDIVNALVEAIDELLEPVDAESAV